MNFRPLHDRVVVKRIDAEEKTAGGIIIPDSAKEKPSQGEITAVGPGGRDEAGKLIPIDLKVGDRVLFGKWSGTEVKLDGAGAADHEGERHHGRSHRSSHLQEEGRVGHCRPHPEERPQGASRRVRDKPTVSSFETRASARSSG